MSVASRLTNFRRRSCYTSGLVRSPILQRCRREIPILASRHGARDVRVFGSLARDKGSEASDLDLLLPECAVTRPLRGCTSVTNELYLRKARICRCSNPGWRSCSIPREYDRLLEIGDSPALSDTIHSVKLAPIFGETSGVVSCYGDCLWQL